MADNKLIVDLVLDPSIDKSSTKKIEKNSTKVGKKSGKNFEKGFEKSTEGLGAKIAGNLKTIGLVAAGIGLARIFTKGIAAAERQEDAINKLNTALQITGKFSAKTSKDLQDYASSLQQVTKFGDEAILESQALIQSLGNLDKQGLKRATAATLDLSAALGIDLRSAATLVGKAAAGEVGSFSRYGVSIKKAETNAITLTNALDALEKKFGGAAAKQVGTFSGATEQAGNAFGDLLEGVGFFITQNPLVISGVQSLTGVFTSLATATVKAAESFNNLFKSDADKGGLQLISEQLEEAKKKVKSYKAAIAEGTGASRGTTQGEIFKKQIPILDRLIKGLERRKKVLEETTNGGADSTEADAKVVLTKQQLADKVRLIGLSQVDALREQQAAQLEIITQAEAAKALTTEDAEARRLEVTRSFGAQIQTINDQTLLNTSASIDGVLASFDKLAAKSKVTSGQVAKAITGGIGRAASAGFSELGRALVSGENAVESFGKAFLKSIGDTLVQQGTAFILEGTAYAFSSNPALTAKAPGLIGAGAAMATFGGVLGASASGGGASSSSGGAASSTDSTSSENTAAFEEQDVERQTQASVNITVEGSLVQQEELGSFISKVISDSNEKSGNVIINPRFA